MRKAFLSWLTVMILTVASIPASHAASGGSRTAHRYGVYLGFVGDPFPTLAGINLGVNVAEWLRLVGGYGSISGTVTDGTGSVDLSVTTVGGGARLFVPGWNFSPVAGVSYANVSVTGASGPVVGNVGGFSSSGTHTYLSGGFDWQTNYGLVLGFGWNHSLKTGVGGLPFINLGWFF